MAFMAAAALLRSVARKVARPPPAPVPRPLLARGVHGGVRSGSTSAPPGGGSLPPPPTGLAGLGSLASKMARAPLPPHQRLLLNERGLHSRASPNSASTPPPTSKMDLRVAEAKTGLFYIVIFSGTIYLCARFMPHKKRSRGKLDALSGDMSELKDLIQTITHEYQDMNVQVHNILAQVRSMRQSGHGKEPDGATNKGTGVQNLEEEVDKLHRIKELEDVIYDLQTENTELKIALESARSEGRV